jgi:hypothetical protein
MSCAMMPLISLLTGVYAVQLIGQPIIRANDRTELARVHNIDDSAIGCCCVSWPFCASYMCSNQLCMRHVCLMHWPLAGVGARVPERGGWVSGLVFSFCDIEYLGFQKTFARLRIALRSRLSTLWRCPQRPKLTPYYTAKAPAVSSHHDPY